ncbi:uncharacterized protein ATC70_008942 [Mucor velutinosus]|uniref:Uncharacterized protein n=1 Tax=Mucor velutinosus TaxID=708070 RepID=A0AAN7HUU7_9FUNG|nr:hypothetical protein ATC70_008942 [Mucor velutinosus]
MPLPSTTLLTTIKLRDRKMYPSGSIEQEDRKFDSDNLTKTPTSTVDESSTSQVTIKQDETKNYRSLWNQQEDEIVKEGCYYHYDMCKKRLANLDFMLEHC